MSRNFLVADDEFNVSIGTFEEEVFVSGAGLRPKLRFQRRFCVDDDFVIFERLEVMNRTGDYYFFVSDRERVGR